MKLRVFYINFFLKLTFINENWEDRIHKGERNEWEKISRWMRFPTGESVICMKVFNTQILSNNWIKLNKTKLTKND